MLTELYHIAKNLRKSDQEQSLVHVDFGDPGLSTNQNLLLTIGESGEILKLEALAPKEAECLWTLKKGNFKFFPAVRMPNPLLSIPTNAPDWNILKKLTAENLRNILAERQKYFLEINLHAESDQATRMQSWNHDDHETLEKLHGFATRFLALAKHPADFSRKVATALDAALARQKDDKSLKAYQTLLCGSWADRKNKPPKLECKAQIIFDYLPKGQLTGILYSPRVKRLVLECLNKEKSPEKKKTKKSDPAEVHPECALTGSRVPLLSGPYAAWSAQPYIGKAFQPYSKNKDAPCNYRYGKADSEGFSIGMDTAKALVSAGCSLTTPAWRGKTWDSIRNGKFEERNGKKSESSDVLIAYPSFPWGELKPVSIFSRAAKEESSENADEEEINLSTPAQTFTQTGESFCKALRAKVPKNDLKSAFIRLLVLRQISPGQVQLAYSSTPSCNRFATSVDHWLASEKNLPPRLKIPLPSKKAESGYGWFAPNLLYPEDAIRVFSHQWMRGGTESSRIQSPPISDIFDVFLRKDGVWEATALRLLEILLPRIEPLLIGAGNILHRIDYQNPSEWREFTAKKSDGKPDRGKPDPRYQLAQSLSLMGTLLYALNSQPTNYMTEIAFQTGKLLAIMDELHKCYCKAERKGDIPPTLIGNGLLGRAADSPEQALEELCERSRIYLGWAKSADPAKASDEKIKIAIFSAKKLLRIAEPLALALHADPALSLPMTAKAKAHLFLGYLSPVLGEKAEPADATNPENDSNP